MPRLNPNRVQMRHPLTGRWHLYSTETGAFIRSAVARWVGVPIKEAKGVTVDAGD